MGDRVGHAGCGVPCDIKTGAPKESQKGIRASRHPCRKDGTPPQGR